MFDLFVIGGGSAGLAAVREARRLRPEWKLAVADYAESTESWGVGGTCVNVGCVPKKLFKYCGTLGQQSAEANAWGWSGPSSPNVQWEAASRHVRHYIQSLNWSIKRELKQLDVTYFKAKAMIHKRVDGDRYEIELKGPKYKGPSRVLTTYLLIATGSRPGFGHSPGADLCWTSDDLFWIPQITPRSKILLIGSGYIALECGSFLHGMNFDVSILLRSRKLLSSMDQQCAAQTGEVLERSGVRFIVNAQVQEFKRHGKQILVRYTDSTSDQEELYDHVILAIGRIPNSQGLGLEHLQPDLKLFDPRGKILVNGRFQTSLRNVFAVGDVCSSIEEGEAFLDLTPVAIQHAIATIRGICGQKYSNSLRFTPSCVFTSPVEYAYVGLSEEQAIERYGSSIEVYYSRYAPLEQLPLEPLPHYDAKLIKSENFHNGVNLFATRKAIGRNLWWPEALYDTDDYSQVYLDRKVPATIRKVHLPTQKDLLTYDVTVEELVGVTLTHVSPIRLTDRGESSRNRHIRYMKANCLCKVITHGRDKILVGIHYIAPHASEAIQPFGLLLQKGMTKDDLDQMIGVHPTSTEEFSTLNISQRSGEPFMKREGCGGGSC